MQEVYIKTFLHIRAFVEGDESRFRAWLLALARNSLRDALRSLATEKRGGTIHRIAPNGDERGHPALWDGLFHVSGTPSRAAAREEIREATLRAVRSLPDPDRTVVWGIDIEGRRAAEIASALGCRRGRVYMIRARAHGLLRTVLAEAVREFSEFGPADVGLAEGA